MSHATVTVNSGASAIPLDGVLGAQAGAVRVENPGISPLFIRADGQALPLVGTDYPAPGFVGYVAMPGRSVDVQVVAATPAAPSLICRHSNLASSAVRISRVGAQPDRLRRWTFARLTANAVTSVPLTAVLGATAGPVLVGTLDIDAYATGDGTTPGVDVSGSVRISEGVLVPVTYTVAGVPTLRVVSSGTALVAVASAE